MTDLFQIWCRFVGNLQNNLRDLVSCILLHQERLQEDTVVLARDKIVYLVLVHMCTSTFPSLPLCREIHLENYEGLHFNFVPQKLN
jgi:hypothetical protein